MHSSRTSSFPSLFMVIAACVIAAVIYHFAFPGSPPDSAKETQADTRNVSSPDNSIDLTQSQLDAIKVESVGTHRFQTRIDAIGSVAYREKDAAGYAGSKNATSFIVANVRESDSPLVHVGESVEASISAYPGRVFSGKVSVVGVTIYDSGGNPAVDPTTHRIAVRCEIADPDNALYPGMLATLVIQIGTPADSVAIPQSGVVREGDGTMTAWVTGDRHRFIRRTVRIGLQQEGYDQILEGLQTGELVVTDGALLLENALTGSPSD